MTKLFTPLKIRSQEFRNRIFVSPMCMYSADEGVPNHWHMVHLGSRAVGGAALVMAEATAVSAEGRISYGDLGLWNEKQLQAFKPIAQFIKENGAVPGIQLAHAGRKAATDLPWQRGQKTDWKIFAPSAIAFDDDHAIPEAMTAVKIESVVEEFRAATKRSLEAGFEVVEIHMAHGYLLNEFLSPLSNQRTDDFGGSLANRMRLPLLVAEEVRKIWPERWPVFVRISATDWVEKGWDLQQSVAFAQQLKKIDIDLVDCSSGGSSPRAKIPVGPSYQVPFAQAIRQEAHILTGAVGLITDAQQAEKILQEDKADVIFLARALLRDPYWALHAAHELGVSVPWPQQYERARPRLL